MFGPPLGVKQKLKIVGEWSVKKGCAANCPQAHLGEAVLACAAVLAAFAEWHGKPGQ
jgi:hypothetical protein